jgi:hypothetical protein
MRLIDADHLSDRVNNSADTPLQKLYVDALLAGEPTIDAVPVVREKGEWVAGERCNHKPCRIKNPENGLFTSVLSVDIATAESGTTSAPTAEQT